MSERSGYQELVVWQQAMDLTVGVYAMTKTWPKDEMDGLTSQSRRAATSVPANIAEGYGREHRGSYPQFLRIAQGSLKELKTHMLIADRVGLLENQSLAQIMGMIESVGKLLRRLIIKLSET